MLLLDLMKDYNKKNMLYINNKLSKMAFIFCKYNIEEKKYLNEIKSPSNIINSMIILKNSG